MNLIIHDTTIITCAGKKIREGAIVVEGNKIVAVGKSTDLKRRFGRGYESIDASGRIVIPGLVNTHQHAAMSLLRGYADDLPLQEWLEKWIWPVEKHMTAHDIYVGALLTAVESAMSGTTTINTMYHYPPGENEAKAFVDAGLRGVVGHVCFSWRKREDRQALGHLARTWHNRNGGLTRASVDPHSPYTVDPEYMKDLKNLRLELNNRYGSEKAPIICHTHIAETFDEADKIRKAFNVPAEGGVLKYLDALSVLDKHVIAAHCVALTKSDMAIMGRRGVKASHNPISNLKLASGISPVPRMLKQGVTVSLGTDSPCSNNSADMFEVMKMASILHKGTNRDPTLMAADHVLRMATIEGAKALSWEDEIGSIEIGKKADLAIVDQRRPHLCPSNSGASHLVYAAKGSDVDMVVVDGKIILEDKKMVTLNTERVMDMAEKAKLELLERLDTNVK